MVQFNIEEARKEAENDRREAEKAKAAILSAIAFLERARGEDRDTRFRLKERIKEAQEVLDTYRKHEVPAVRRKVWLALFLYELSRPLETRKEVEDHIARLVQKGLLKEDPAGPLKVYDKTYSVSPDSLFEGPEIAEVKRELAGLLNRVFLAVRKNREQRLEAMQAQASINWQGLLAGKAGQCLIYVPPEKVTQNGTTFWRGGGALLVESDGQKIVPIDAIGGIEGAIQEAKDLGVHLLVKALGQNTPPFIKGIPAEQGKKVQLLWHLLKRGIRAAEEAKRISRQREEFANKATLTPGRFFLQGEPGLCLVEYEGDWKVRSPEGVITNQIPNLFLLVSREEKEGVKRIRIVEVPDHLKEFFAPCIGKEYPEGDNKFGGIAQPLRAVLQAIYGQVLQASKDAEKAGQIVNGK